MTIKFSTEELNLITSISDNLNNNDKKIMENIITKIKKINKNRDNYNKANTKRILELRKEDKFYARDNKVIQNHFNTTARKIKKLLLNGKSKEARDLYKIMLDEAKLPKYEVQYNNAMTDNLSKQELDFLNKEVD